MGTHSAAAHAVSVPIRLGPRCSSRSVCFPYYLLKKPQKTKSILPYKGNLGIVFFGGFRGVLKQIVLPVRIDSGCRFTGRGRAYAGKVNTKVTQIRYDLESPTYTLNSHQPKTLAFYYSYIPGPWQPITLSTVVFILQGGPGVEKVAAAPSCDPPTANAPEGRKRRQRR